MIVLFGGEKGGTGKSTLATNLALALARARQDLVVVDTDKQRSAATWADTRSANAATDELPRVHCIEKQGEVMNAVKDLADRYSHIIIDAGGRDSKELRSAMAVAERMYIPIKASQFDLWTAERMNELIGQVRAFNTNLDVHAILSVAPTNPRIGEADEAKELLAEYDELPLATTIIRERKSYRDAIVDGKGVLELDNEKVVQEVEALAREIFNGAF